MAGKIYTDQWGVTFGGEAPTGPSGVKTINMVAIASVKTINTVAIASVKKINDAT